MRRLLIGGLVAAALASSVYDIEADDLQSGLPVPLSYYQGKVMLIVNVASQCGSTDSTYRYLNTLQSRYASRGLSILAFPCNSFGGQEPGSPEEILTFATKKQKASFDFFRKVEVNGPSAHPLFKWLLGESGDCADEDTSCAAWAGQGECDSNPEFMRSSCKRSCKLCSAPAGVGQPIAWNFESFLLSRSGQQIARWKTGTDITLPEHTQQIEALLDAKDEI